MVCIAAIMKGRMLQKVARLHDLEKAHLSLPLSSDVIPEQTGRHNPAVFFSQACINASSLYHDETAFQSNDDQKFAWEKEGDSFIKMKCRGSGIMISDFIYKYDGYLGFTDDQYENYRAQNCTSALPQKARVRLEFGQNRDGYWRPPAFVNQVKTAVEIAEINYSSEVFDFLCLCLQSQLKPRRTCTRRSFRQLNERRVRQKTTYRDAIWNGSVQRIVLDDAKNNLQKAFELFCWREELL